jgi:ketosteroid isomerase-like protein
MNKIQFFIVGVVTFWTSLLSAQENVSAVLDKYTKKIGGLSNILRVQNIYSLANCTGPNGEYQTEIHSASESKTIFRQIRKNKRDYVGIVNGDTYWTSGKEIEISNKYLAFAWRSHELQWIATHLTERFQDLKYNGYEYFAGKQAVKLSGIDELNKTAQLYFDINTNLLLGIIIFSPISEKPETIRLEIKEWKKVGNLQLPSSVSFLDQQGIFELNFHTIKINQINLAVFDIPMKIIAIKKIMELHELQRKAHFNRDAKLLVSMMSDDFMEISNGKISSPKKDELTKRFQGYFDTVRFIEWDDLQPPIIKVSMDGTMAYMHVNKRVRIKTIEENDELTTFAWTSTFQKINGNWIMTSISSTVVR